MTRDKVMVIRRNGTVKQSALKAHTEMHTYGPGSTVEASGEEATIFHFILM